MSKHFTYFPPSSFLWMRHLTIFLLSFWRQVVALPAPPKRWVRLLPLLALLLTQWVLVTEQARAQSLQWSQYTGANSSWAQTSDAKYAPDGSIYTFLKSFNGQGARDWPCDDVKFTGPIGVGGSNPTLCKYSPDGKLLWVRILSYTSDPYGMDIGADGKPVVMVQAWGPAPDLITPNAFRSSYPSGGGIVGMVVRFDADGNLEYGSYLGMNGSIYGQFYGVKGVSVGTDGSIRLAMNLYPGTTIPTTPNAYQATDPEILGIKPALMIFNADGSLRYGSYFSPAIKNDGVLSLDIEKAPNNQFLWLIDRIADTEGGYPASAITYPITPGAAYPTRGGYWWASYLALYNADGTLAHSTYVPGVFGAHPRVKPNGNIVVVCTVNSEAGFNRPSEGFTYANPTNTYGALCVIEFNPTLTAVVKKEVLNQKSQAEMYDAAIDDMGRLHVVSNTGSFYGPVLPTTPGALQATPTTATGPSQGVYQIYDCDYNPLHYSTYMTGTGGDGLSALFGLDTRGSKALLSGTTGQNAFPVTPIAYNDAGTGTLTGFDIKRNNQGYDGFLAQFNYPKINANVVSAVITSYCQGAGVQPITGQPIGYQQLSTVLGRTDGNPAPVSNYYQWQIATAAGGPWTDILDATTQSYTPEAQNITGSRFYRRLAQQTPFGATCQPAADVQSISNVIEYQFSTNVVHTTDLSDKPYAVCAGSTITVTANVTPGSDGNQGAYSWKLTTLLNINTALATGSVASAPGTIDLTINKAGDYLLQVTDARGCVSYDTLTVKKLTIDAGSRIQFTCGASTIKLGPAAIPPVFVNYPNPVFAWSPSTGLTNTSGSNPTLDVAAAGIGVGQSKDYYLDFNGCRVDTITVTNETIAPLPALPDLSACQGDTVRLGLGITAQTGVTYEWAPGLGLTANNIPRPVVTTAYAPQGVNVINYTLLASNGTSGCAQTTTQKVTTFRFPNQSFNLKNTCLQGSNQPSKQVGFDNPLFGTVSEPGITYEWTASIVPSPGTTDAPTQAQIQAGISDPTAAKISFQLPLGVGHPATGGYSLTFVRKSYNTANPSCMRMDTASDLTYCRPGLGGSFCAAALGALPTAACGSPTNKIGPANLQQAGRIVWSRVDGQPLSGLFDVDTNEPLTDGGPHSAQVIANPTGLVSITYRLTFYAETGDTCRLDVKVFPGAISKPTANYTSPIAACKGATITIAQTAQPAYSYAWTPKALVDDSTKANPTTIALLKDESLYVTVTDTVTKCFVQDTVMVKITPVDVNAGADAAYCVTSGGTFNIGSASKSGYTYQWTTSTAGVTFGDATASQTTAVIPANTAGPVQLILNATNGNTTANCAFADTVIYTSFAAPAFTIPNPGPVCLPGGSVNIDAAGLPAGTFTYAWTTADGTIVGSASTASIKASAPGTYALQVSSGDCQATQQVTIVETVYPTVTAGPFSAPCATPVTLEITNAASLNSNWSFFWTPSTGVVSQSADFSKIEVYPSANTTYTLTGIFGAGCIKTFTFDVPGATYAPILASNYSFCEGSGSAQLPLNAAPSGATYAWTATPASALAYLSDPTAQQPTINFDAAVAGTYTYTVTVTYDAGCTATATTTVKIGKKIDGIVGVTKVFCAGTCVQIGSATALTGVNYTWSTDPFNAADVATISNVSASNPTVCPTKTTTYKLTYFDANTGCTFTDKVTVQQGNPAPTLIVQNIKACQNAAGTVTVDLASATTTNN